MRMDELMSLAEWRHFEEALHRETGLNACAFDPDGVRITNFVEWANPLCPVIKGDPDAARAICAVAHQEIAREARRTRQPVVAECDAGLVKICVPIFVGEEFVGIAGGCGRLRATGEVETFHVTCVTGLPEARIRELAADIPRLPPGGARAAAEFIRRQVDEVLRSVDAG
jgi:ligand-binding sensor protein